MEEEVVKRRRLSPVLANMRVGDKEEFPVEQYSSIALTIQRLQTRMARSGAKWSQKKEGLSIIVERTA